MDFQETLQQILAQHSEYKPDAYRYIYAVTTPATDDEELDKPDTQSHPKHLSAQMLYQALCKRALKDFGPLAATVFRVWGLCTPQDIGRATYYMVDAGILCKQPHESAADFDTLPPLMPILRTPYL